MTVAVRNILLSLIVSLSLLSLVLYVANLRQDRDIVSFKSRVSELSQENSILNSRVATLKMMWFATNVASKEQQEGLSKKEQTERETMAELENLPKNLGASDAKDDQSDVLPADVVRVLQRHCDQIRGKTCDNP